MAGELVRNHVSASLCDYATRLQTGGIDSRSTTASDDRPLSKQIVPDSHSDRSGLTEPWTMTAGADLRARRHPLAARRRLRSASCSCCTVRLLAA